MKSIMRQAIIWTDAGLFSNAYLRHSASICIKCYKTQLDKNTRGEGKKSILLISQNPTEVLLRQKAISFHGYIYTKTTSSNQHSPKCLYTILVKGSSYLRWYQTIRYWHNTNLPDIKPMNEIIFPIAAFQIPNLSLLVARVSVTKPEIPSKRLK